MPTARTGSGIRNVVGSGPPPRGLARRAAAEPTARTADRPGGLGGVAAGRVRPRRSATSRRARTTGSGETIERGPGDTVTRGHVTVAGRYARTTGPSATAEALRPSRCLVRAGHTAAARRATAAPASAEAGSGNAVTRRDIPTRAAGPTTTAKSLRSTRAASSLIWGGNTTAAGRAGAPPSFAERRSGAGNAVTRGHIPGGPAATAKALRPAFRTSASTTSAKRRSGRGNAVTEGHIPRRPATTTEGLRASRPTSNLVRAGGTAARRATRSATTAEGVRLSRAGDTAAWHVGAGDTAPTSGRARATGPPAEGRISTIAIGTRAGAARPATAAERLRPAHRGLGRGTAAGSGLAARNDRGCDHRGQAARGCRSTRRRAAPPRWHGTGSGPATRVVSPTPVARWRLPREPTARRPTRGRYAGPWRRAGLAALGPLRSLSGRVGAVWFRRSPPAATVGCRSH